MSFIPELTMQQFQEMCEKDLQEFPSVIIKGEDGNYLGTFIIPQTDFIKIQAEYLGEQSNGVVSKIETQAREMMNAPHTKCEPRSVSISTDKKIAQTRINTV
jgi:hypothetical protein